MCVITWLHNYHLAI